MFRRHRVVLLGAVAATLAATALPATAQTTDADGAADASAGVVRLRAQGSDLLTIAESSASLNAEQASATAVPLAVADNPFGNVTATSDGAAVREPAEGDGCQAATDALTGVVDLGLVCGVASADLDGGTATATSGVADAQVLTLQLDGSAIAQVEDVLLGPLGLRGQLDILVGEALRGLVDPLAEECELSLAGLVDGAASELPGLGDLPLGEVTGALDDVLGQVTDQLPVVCELLQTVSDVLAGEGGVFTGGELSGILDGTSGVVELTLLETVSTVTMDGTTASGDARPTGAAEVAVNLPLGDALQTGLEDVLTSLTEGLLGQVTGPVADELGLSPDDPAGDLAAQILGTEGISGLLDGQLLSLTLTPGRAAASVTVDGPRDVVAEPAIVALGGSIFELPPLADLDATLNDVAGQLDASLLATLRDTPLADLVSITLLDAETNTDATVQGLPGATARSGAASVQLFAVADGGIELEVSPATAAAGATGAEEGVEPQDTPEPAPAPADNLPRTGGGFALAGVLALAGAAGLRRRR